MCRSCIYTEESFRKLVVMLIKICLHCSLEVLQIHRSIFLIKEINTIFDHHQYRKKEKVKLIVSTFEKHVGIIYFRKGGEVKIMKCPYRKKSRFS